MSASTLTNICSSGNLDIGIVEVLSEEESAHLKSSSKTQLETIAPFLDLTAKSRDMSYPRHSINRSGKPIPHPSRAPESERYKRDTRPGPGWNNGFDDERPPTSGPSSSSNFQAIGPPIHKLAHKPSIAQIDRRDLKSLSGRNPVAGSQCFFDSKHQSTKPSFGSQRILDHALIKIMPDARHNNTQPSTSKQAHSIKGAAAKAGRKPDEGKGKGKAILSHQPPHIDLTEECEEEEEEIEISLQEETQNTYSNQNVIDHLFSAIDTNSAGEESDDPLLMPTAKRIESMKGKDSKNSNKSINRQPHMNGQNKKAKITCGPPIVKLKTVKFPRAQVAFSHSGASLDMSIIGHRSGRFSLQFSLDDSRPGPEAFVNIPLAKIKQLYYHHGERRPSQLVVELSEDLDGQDLFNKYIRLHSAESRAGQPFNACLVEVLDESFNVTMKELVAALQNHLEPRAVKTGRIDEICTFCFPQDPCSDYEKFQPSLKSEPASARRPATHSSHEPSPNPHSSSKPLNGKALDDVISTLPSVSPSVYKSNKVNQIHVPTSQNETAKQTSDFESKLTVNRKEDSKALNSIHKQSDDLECQASKATQKNTDVRQELQDGKVAARYNTRNKQLQSSIPLPVDPRVEPPLGSSINGADSDIVLVWPFEGERNCQSVAITKGDMNRLNEGEFLNDTLIEFGLIWELSQIRKRNPELVASIHLFNSFFFQKLSGCKSKEKSAAVEAAEAYPGVRKWTKGIDIFKKEFLVIPINEHMHWYFMIVSNPGKMLDPEILLPEPNPATFSSPMKTRLSHKAEDSFTKQSYPTTSEPPVNQTKSRFFKSPADTSKTNLGQAQQGIPAEEMVVDDPTMDNSAQALQDMDLDDHKSSAQDGVKNPPSSTAAPNDDMKLPYVLTLDSLGTAHRPQAGTIVRYLINEAKDKLEKTLPESVMKAVTTKKVPVPEQPNFCDCGLYLIHAFKTFFSQPSPMLRWILDYNSKKGQKEQRQSEICRIWDAAGAAQARAALKAQIKDLIPQYQAIIQQRNKAAAEKKEQARIRKLSCTDGPQVTNHESAKKQRLNYSEQNGQVTSISSRSGASCPEPPARSTSNKRFLEESSNSQAEKDELYEEHIIRPKTTKSTSPSPTGDQLMDTVPDQAQIILDLSPEPIAANEEKMVDNRSITPDEDLILNGISAPSPHTPEDSPSLDHNLSVSRIDVDHDEPTPGIEEKVFVNAQSSEPTTPPEITPDHDGEAIPPEPASSPLPPPSSSLTELDSSVQSTSPQPVSKSRGSSPAGNHAIGLHPYPQRFQIDIPPAQRSRGSHARKKKSSRHSAAPQRDPLEQDSKYNQFPNLNHNNHRNANNHHGKIVNNYPEHFRNNNQKHHHNPQNNPNHNHNNIHHTHSSNDYSTADTDVSLNQNQGNSLNPLMVEDD
ncbi:hypothetical protein PGT21_003398 [Puccinia graminis f. sp. tritici]|uniref:Ubiquitin-like protease family profile domain-containing protein n=1 Tax=Puccinia graminis f. sp. tritici TaxID=56615 RepID=A0A5B0P4Y3_PUCGR|nr:hypothetical protein PGT21_003398 [Puccinia graminis f. sp. tritici]KAA1137154.1 hypothetical protein PGTUg99_005729 [Puccinia graminis f. sp. tritici]